jgi:hypothetical protein
VFCEFLQPAPPPPLPTRKCTKGILNRDKNPSARTLSTPSSAIFKLSADTFLETFTALLNKLIQDVFSLPFVSPSNVKHDLSVGSQPDSTEQSLRSVFFRDFTQREVVIRYGSCGTIYRSPLQGSSSPLKMGQIGCSATSVTNYQSSPCKISEAWRLYLHRGSSWKLRTVCSEISMS